MNSNQLNLKNITQYPNYIARFGKGCYAMLAARNARYEVQAKPYTNVCPSCGVKSGTRRCAETHFECADCMCAAMS